MRLDGTDHIREIGFACIVKQTAKLNPLRVAADACFFHTIQAVLCHGVEMRKMSICSAEQGKGVSNVPDLKIFLAGVEGIHADPLIGGNVTHRDNFLFMFKVFQAAPTRTVVPMPPMSGRRLGASIHCWKWREPREWAFRGCWQSDMRPYIPSLRISHRKPDDSSGSATDPSSFLQKVSF